MPWPRKNDPASIRARQERTGIGGLPVSVDLGPFADAAEALTGVAIIPVSVCPIRRRARQYQLDDDGERCRDGRARGERPRPARAHRREPDALDDARRDGGRTSSRPTCSPTGSHGRRASSAATRRRRSRSRGGSRASCRRCATWLALVGRPGAFARARLREVKTHVVGPMCHVLWAWTTGDAVGPNMMTRNAYALNMGYVMAHAPVKPERAILEANMGGDKKPSYEYFHSGPRQDGDRGGDAHGRRDRAGCCARRADDLEALSWAGHARRDRVRHAVGRLHARRRRSPRSSPRPARTSAWSAPSSMAHGTARRVEGGLHATIRFPGSRSGRSAAARRCLRRATGSRRSAAPAPAGSTASRRSSPRRRCASRSAPPPRWRPRAARTSSGRTTSEAASAEGSMLWGTGHERPA